MPRDDKATAPGNSSSPPPSPTTTTTTTTTTNDKTATTEVHPQTPPPVEPQPQTIGDLKIVHSSPPAAPKTRAQQGPEAMTREQLLEQAERFLDSAPIKNAPLREKMGFLHAKGLTRAEVEALLDKMAEKGVGRKVMEKDKGKGKGIVKAEPSSSAAVAPASKSAPAATLAASAAPAASAASTASAASSVAPIVTYPEFLTPAPPPPPPPLVTAKSIGKALYFATGAAATIYGANKLVLTPMHDALTAARLDLSNTALTNLTELNTRLKDLVPEGPTRRRVPTEEDDSDGGSTSDPGEMFHVDAQTQTSPSLENFPLDNDEVDISSLSTDSKLEHLSTQLQTLVESHSDGTDNELTFALEDLTSYLETLTYDWPGINIFSSPYGGYGGNKDKDKDDPVAKVKAEIRSVKGVLLNSKNFPASR